MKVESAFSFPLVFACLALAAPASGQATQEQRLTTGVHGANPAWSADGARIVFESARSGSVEHWTVPSSPQTGQPPERLPAPPDAGERPALPAGVDPDESPAWSPDLSRIVFVRGGDLWIMPASGGEPRPLTSGPARDTSPSWSPDGTRIAFQSDRAGNEDVWVIAATGGDPEPLTTDARDDTDPAWAPTSEQVVFVRDGDLWLAALASVDIAVTKSVNDSTPDEGDAIEFTVTASNQGPDNATGVRITDLLPAGVTYASDSTSHGTYAAGTGLWNVGDLAVSASDTLWITATVDAGTAGDTIQNLASLTGVNQVDTNPANNSAAAALTVRAIDLAVTKTVDDAAPDEGGTVVFTVTVSNGGPDDATGVEITDLLPAGLAYSDSLPSQGSYEPGTGAWTVGTLAVGGTATLDLTASVDLGTAGQVITNTATRTASDQADTNAANDSASVSITVRSVDLAVTKVVDDPAPNEGGTIVYTVAVSNLGPEDATGVEVTDVLPPGLTFVSAVPPGDYTAGTGLWTVGDLANGDADTLRITATVDAGTADSTISNTAALTATDPPDINPANDSGTAQLTVQAIDLAVAKVVDVARPDEGGTVVFTVTVSNAGPDDATGVEITDLLPAGLAYSDSLPSQGSYEPGTGVWTVGTLAVGGSATLDLTASVDLGTAGRVIPNTATRTASDQADTNPANDVATAEITVRSADLTLTKSVDDPSPGEGSVILYTITVTNLGPDDATDVAVTDSLPDGVTFTSAVLTQGEYDSVTGLWTVNDLPASGSATAQLRATVDDGTAGTTITNVATRTASAPPDTNPDNDRAEAVIRVQAIDLVVTKIVDDPAPNEGDAIVYTVSVTNAGPDDATGVEVTDLLPAGVTFVSAVPPGDYTAGTGLWNVGAVPVGATATLDLNVTVDPGTADSTITNTASVTGSDQVDTNPANDSDSVDIRIPAVDLAVTKVVDRAVANGGETIVYTVTISNVGPDDATGVEVTDVLPDGVTFGSSTPSQGSYDEVTGLWAVEAVANGAFATLDITATVDPAAAGTTVVNTATRTASDQADTNGDNDEDTADVRVPAIDIAIGKSVSDPLPLEGSLVTFTVTATNLGPDPATGVRVRDQVPAGLAFAGAVPSKGIYTVGTGVWVIDELTNGGFATLALSATVNVGTAGDTITNCAVRTASDQVDTNAANDSACVSVTVRDIDIAVAKSVDDPAPDEGDTIVYTVAARNDGPNPATGVEITDVLDSRLTFVSATPAGAYDSGSGVWTLGALGVADSDTLRITATVDAGTAGQTIPNTATRTGADQVDTNPANDSASVDVTVRSADLAMAKTVDIALPNEGDTIVYTVTVTNLGPEDATGVEVTDQLPLAVTFVSDTTSQGSYESTTGAWTVGNLVNGASATLDLTVTVNAGSAGATYENRATLTAVDPVDPNAANDSASVDIRVPLVNLAVTKSVDVAMPGVGDPVVYTVAVASSGPDDATGVEITDLLPVGLTYVSANATQGAYDNGTGVWTVGDMEIASRDTLWITATVDPGTVGQTLTNTATLTAVDQTEGSLEDNSASVDITVVPTVDAALVDFVPETFALAPGRPNPFRDTMTLQFDIPLAAEAELVVFDISGRLVATLVKGPVAPGRFVVRWDGRDRTGQTVSAGVYFVQLRAGSFRGLEKVIRLP